jgi:hypothetical protein
LSREVLLRAVIFELRGFDSPSSFAKDLDLNF